jgi:integrase
LVLWASWVQIPPPAPITEPTGFNGELFNFALWMQKQGYSPSTIRSSIRTLRAVAKKANLLNQDAVKIHLTSRNVSIGRKEKICQDLARFYKFKQLAFEMPRYRRIESVPFVPLETEIDQLISASGKKTATFLQLLKETGVRPGEAWQLKWRHFDFERASVTITPEKGSNARQLKISNRLIAMLNALPHQYEYSFRNPEIDPEKSMRTYQKVFEEQRKRIARKLQNPRINAISFKSLRHWRASNLYHRTKDILLVKTQLGHKSLTSTLVYTHLISFKEDDYVCKAAQTIEEAKPLIESGFEYVTTYERYMIFRKRK